MLPTDPGKGKHHRRLGLSPDDIDVQKKEVHYYLGYIDGLVRARSLIARLNTPCFDKPDDEFEILIEGMFSEFGADDAVSILELIEEIGPLVIFK